MVTHKGAGALGRSEKRIYYQYVVHPCSMSAIAIAMLLLTTIPIADVHSLLIATKDRRGASSLRRLESVARLATLEAQIGTSSIYMINPSQRMHPSGGKIRQHQAAAVDSK